MGLPVFIWENVFTVINTLVCGLIVALFTSTFLKKKEERTRIAGVILGKRINSEQELLTYLEKQLFKEEINIENSSKYDVEITEFLSSFDLPVPYERNVQYLRTAEISTEQNYNMIDGRRNNIESQKQEKTSKEKDSLLGRLKEKQQFLIANARKEDKEKRAERDLP